MTGENGEQETQVLDIQGLTAGGDAIARHEGKAVFVAGGCPGDRVRARMIQRGKRFDRAQVEEILSPGPSRTTPPCPVFATCGGCQWQHVAYEQQVIEKTNILAENLRRLGGFETPPPTVEPSEPFGYRIRARLFRDKRGVFGFRRERSHEAVDASACLVLHPALLAAAFQVGAWMDKQGRVGDVDVGLNPESGAAAVWLHDRASKETLESLMAACDVLVGAVAGSGDVRLCVGDPAVPLSGGGRWETIPHPIDAFWQANDALNRRVLELVSQATDMPLADNAPILELFSGSGNLTRVLVGSGRRVVAVEQNPVACARLERWAQEKGWGLTLWCASVARGLVRARRELARPAAVVLDPPRAGLGEAMKDLLRLEAARVVYLSCDTATLARDCRLLAEAGYRAVSVTMLDFFPQTHHVESLVVMER